MGVTDAQGFPKQHKKRRKTFLGYRTSDSVKAMTPKRTLTGRIAPSFRPGNAESHPKK
ncbi:hypothetical protein KTT_39370 [Tengunoibacter tsumagoiensis]|uniref:Uncharacterized protein n=2 Tax=Tengunoibacter tsumagoiensis TaxID=2014871 RepID=A0A402A4K7_9CHLR|nr:hypothetical protein KTT_39370 [Tengunoibacter tsumagoiensis]